MHLSGSAAEAAAELKIRKYSALATSHHFVPFAIETLGPICKTASDLISEISLRSSERFGSHAKVHSCFENSPSQYSVAIVLLFTAHLGSFPFNIHVFVLLLVLISIKV